MKTGDTVRDANGRTYQVGQLLGRGVWGRTYAAREEGSSVEYALKVPLRARDVTDSRSVTASREVVTEMGRVLAQGAPGLIALENRFSLEDGSPVLVLPRFPATVERRLASGCTLEELLTTTVQVIRRLREAGSALPVHGNLKPTNLLLDERGGVWLSDPVTAAMRRHLELLLPAAPAAWPYLPPEVRDSPDSALLTPGTDAYALAMMLYRGAMLAPDGTGKVAELPLGGLDKARVVALKDRVYARLKEEHSNPRFHTRLSDRLAALLNRALSLETSPSPPYRFNRLDEFQARAEEVLALVHPSVTQVGRLIFDLRPGKEEYHTDEDVTFTCAVACSAGVDTHEEIACGIAVFDADRDERMRAVPCAYTVDRHPSGRFRFSFRISGLAPGNFRARVAFTIRESGDEPATAEGEFVNRAAAGYVPPAQEPTSRPLSLNRSDPGDETNPGTSRDDAPTSVTTPTARVAVAPAIATVVVPEVPAPSRREAPPEPAAPIPTPVAPPRTREPMQRTAPVVPPRPPTPPAPTPTIAPRPPAPVTPKPPPPRPASPRPVTRAVRPAEPRPPETPTFQGSWSELPLPDRGGEELPGPRNDPPTRAKARPLSDDDRADDDREPPGPIGAALARALETVRGDAYVLFLGVATVVIVVLVIVLLAIR